MYHTSMVFSWLLKNIIYSQVVGMTAMALGETFLNNEVGSKVQINTLK